MRHRWRRGLIVFELAFKLAFKCLALVCLAALGPNLCAAPQPMVSAMHANQAGYVHFWEMTLANGELETQVGMALQDQRIVWSLPGLGVRVTPFMANGVLALEGQRFQLRYRYGLAPLLSPQALEVFRQSLLRRVAVIVGRRIPYCPLNGERPGVCMSCMALVSQLLFPGQRLDYPLFPPQFPRVAGESYYTTEDLLLYLSGFDRLPSTARDAQLAQLQASPALREDLLRLTERYAEVLPLAAPPTAVPTQARPRR